MKTTIKAFLKRPIRYIFLFQATALSIYIVATIYESITKFPPLICFGFSCFTFVILLIYIYLSETSEVKYLRHHFEVKNNQLQVVKAYVKSSSIHLNKTREELEQQMKAKRIVEGYNKILEERIKALKSEHITKESSLNSDIATIKTKIGALESGKKRTIKAIIKKVNARDEELANDIQKEYLN